MRCGVSLFFLAILTIASALTDSEEWLNFKKNHGKVYKNSVEENVRFSLFRDNLRKIKEHNEEFEQGLSTYKMGMNMFGDLSPEEFRDQYLKPLPKMNRPPPSLETKHVHYHGNPPGRKDWREKGAVTKVKDQASCGGCWAFSTAGAIESAHFIQSGKLVSMSEQVLIDCVKECNGCNGCWPEKAMTYVEEQGITTEAAYPYKGIDEACQINGTEATLKIKDYVFVKYDDEEDLKQAVGRQPVSVTLDAGHFQFYSSGIYYDKYCVEALTLNHAVLVIGYDLDHYSGEDYWIIKNSWGTGWGMGGYMNFIRNWNNCGIASHALYPVM